MARRQPVPAILLLTLIVLALAGAGLWWFLHLAPGPMRLTKTRFADVPGWSKNDTKSALSAFRRSCSLLANRADSEAMGRYAGTAADWRQVCAAADQSPSLAHASASLA